LGVGFLSTQRTVQALADLFGIPVSAGTVAALTAGLQEFLTARSVVWA
jgi:hypothetical protein